MIKIVQGVYGHYTGSIVEPKDKNSEPFALSPEQEARLVEQGVAVYADGTHKGPIAAEPEGEKTLEEMSSKELREYAKPLGLSFKVGIKNADMIAEIKKCLNNTADDPDESDATSENEEPAPTYDPTQAVK